MRLIFIYLLTWLITCPLVAQEGGKDPKSDSAEREQLERWRQVQLRRKVYEQMYAMNPKAAVDSANKATMQTHQTEGQKRLMTYRTNTRIDTLVEIDLSYAGLDEIPEFVLRATKLKVLILDHNEIRKLPKQLARLQHLERVYWRANHLDRFLWVRIQRIPNLKKLDLSNNLLERLPRGVRKLKGLDELVLDQNFFEEVPIRRLSKANFLNQVSFNQSHALKLSAAKYEKLAFLEVFKANNSRLSAIDPDFYNLRGLKELQLQENKLVSLPIGISQMEKLEKLSLYKNRLESLPEDLYKLDLKVIDLYYNALEKISEELGQLSNLEVLFLANNRIYSLPQSIGKLSNLTEMYVHHNRLSVLPESIGLLNKLTVARVNDNYLVDFPTQFLKMQNLYDLDISNNQITTIPDEVESLPKLRLFTFQENPIDVETQANAHVAPMIVRMMDAGVTCVPRIYAQEAE
ncbi:leucine-rich repeat domain-containing protein [Marinoscillum sp.]|uniref:leucine-rich repeat domain-containing protein n=1 Tax=Marinoscillum sp. TaxID=2024838 RepID=UPI003BAC3CFA